MIREFSLEEIEKARKNISINDFMRSSKESRNYCDSKYFPQLLKDVFRGDEYATTGQYSGIIGGFEKWWDKQRDQLGTWMGISGSWRIINQTVVDDTAEIVRLALRRGYGIVTGGAAGPDYIASQIVVDEGDPSKSLRIVLPAEISTWLTRLGDVADSVDPEMHPSQARRLSKQIYDLKDRFPECIFEVDIFDEDKFLDPINYEFRTFTYLFRNNLIAMASDGLAAFQVNESGGVEDIVSTVSLMNKPVYRGGLNSQGYIIDPDSSEVISDYNNLIIPKNDIEYYRNKINSKMINTSI